MDLDRGVLARIDRRLLAGLDRDERFQMVRVPVTPAKWSTWKRYCDAAGISMGRAIVALIDHELASKLDTPGADLVKLLWCWGLFRGGTRRCARCRGCGV